VIGVRVGVTVGPRAGLAAGVSENELASSGSSVIPGVTRDAAGGKYFPANATEWTAFMAAAGLATGNPASCWNMQEASGNAADAIGAITLTQTSMSLYQQAVTGYTRFSIRGIDGQAAALRNLTTAPNPSLTSTLVGGVVDFSTIPAGVRDLLGVATNAVVQFMITTGKLQLVNGSTVQTASAMGTAVRPVLLRINNTAGTATLFTDLEKTTATYVLPTSGTLVSYGRVAATIASVGYLYGFEFTGTAAELSDAQVKTLLTTASWSIPWT
jgi:hypothetical protein